MSGRDRDSDSDDDFGDLGSPRDLGGVDKTNEIIGKYLGKKK